MTPRTVLRPTFRSNTSIGKGTSQRCRIFLVDHHPIVLKGLAKVIRTQPEWRVCGSATEYSRALSQIRALKPDLIIVNLDVNGRSGLELVRALQEERPKPLALVFSMHDERLYASRALRAGASGYVMKQEPTETLAQAIRQILDGGTYVSSRLGPKNARGVASRRETPVLDRLETLTNRELHIFRLIGQGKRSQEIAGLLSVSVKTIGSHRSNMMAKLSLENSSQLVQHAIELNREHRREQGPAPGAAVGDPSGSAGLKSSVSFSNACLV